MRGKRGGTYFYKNGIMYFQVTTSEYLGLNVLTDKAEDGSVVIL